MIGIIQGRLTDSGGKLQCFPNNDWEKEFITAREIGLDYIELISDPERNDKNPIWSGAVERVKNISKETGVRAYSLTIDHIMYRSLTSEDREEALESKESLFLILKHAGEAGVRTVVLPFLEKASLKNGLLANAFEVIREVSEYAAKYNIKLAIESDLTVEDQLRIVEASEDVGICYDVGNRTYFGFVPKDEIPLLDQYIVHAHIKDKSTDGTNVMLGEGVVDLVGAIGAFKSINYTGNYTMESSRGDEEVAAAIKNLGFLKALL